jgi:hypothetical protein
MAGLIRLISISVISLLLAGCGGGSSSGSSGSISDSQTEPASSATSDQSEAAQRAADLRIAQAMTSQFSDFPKGWARKTSMSSHEEKQCQIDRSDLVRTASTFDPTQEFDESATHFVLAGAATWATVSDAEKAYDRAASSGIIRCQARVIEGGVPEVDHAEISRVHAFPRICEDIVDYRFTYRLSASSNHANLYLDWVILRVGRGTSVIAGVRLRAPFEQPLLKHLVRVAVSRGAAVQATDAAA